MSTQLVTYLMTSPYSGIHHAETVSHRSAALFPSSGVKLLSRVEPPLSDISIFFDLTSPSPAQRERAVAPRPGEGRDPGAIPLHSRNSGSVQASLAYSVIYRQVQESNGPSPGCTGSHPLPLLQEEEPDYLNLSISTSMIVGTSRAKASVTAFPRSSNRVTSALATPKLFANS